MKRDAASLLPLLRARLRQEGDPAKAGPIQAYMKSAMPFRGVPAPVLRAVCRDIFSAHRMQSQQQWQAECLAIWRAAKHREERHAAIELTGHRFYRDFQTMDALAMYEEMIVTGAWWDYVDVIASHRLGPLLTRYPAAMRKKMLNWSRSADMWKRRSAILCQLGFKKQTDLKLLYAVIEPSLDSKEFFLRKGIGWALRQYAWTDPAEIARWVSQNKPRLNPLTVREALKNISRIAGEG